MSAAVAATWHELGRLAGHDTIFGDHSPLPRLAQLVARVLCDAAGPGGQCKLYVLELAKHAKQSRRSVFRSLRILQADRWITILHAPRGQGGKFSGRSTYTLHFGPGARRRPTLQGQRARALVDQLKRGSPGVNPEFNQVPGWHGSGSLDPISLQEITEPPSHPVHEPTAAPSSGTVDGDDREGLRGAPPPARPSGGSHTQTEIALGDVLHSACRTVAGTPAPKRRVCRKLARDEMNRLAQGLLAKGLSALLVLRAATEYASETGPWRYWRNLRHGVTEILTDPRAWAGDAAPKRAPERPPDRGLRKLESVPMAVAATPKVAPVSPPKNVHGAPSAEEREARIARFVGRPPKREAAPEPGPMPPRPQPSPAPATSTTTPELGDGFASMLAFLRKGKGKNET